MQSKLRLNALMWTILTAFGLPGPLATADDPPSSDFRLRQDSGGQDGGQVFPKPYSPPCVERENVFEFTEKPAVKKVGEDKYEITFAVRGNCDVAVGIIDPSTSSGQGEKGVVVRHLGAGVLGPNAPLPFQKKSLKQTIYWNGKDDLDEYHKTPEKLRVRVMLGLKPEFDKRLCGTSPKNFPGSVCGVAISESAAFVFILGNGATGHVTLRKFDLDGRYVRSLLPPVAGTPEEKMGGFGYIEYEPGKKGIHATQVLQTVANRGNVLPGLGGGSIGDMQPVVRGNRLIWCNSGAIPMEGQDSRLHYMFTDGATTAPGLAGKPFAVGVPHRFPRLAVSPDGQWVYLSGAGAAVYRGKTDGSEPAAPFLGKWTEKWSGEQKRKYHVVEPGSDNQSLNNPLGIACDTLGRIYVADNSNNRVQIFSPDGKYLKTIPADRPKLVQVHQKTSAIYVLHLGRVQGKTLGRVTKYVSFDNLTEEFHSDSLVGAVMGLDSCSPKPRLWLACDTTKVDGAGVSSSGPGLCVYEEEGKTLCKILDFNEDARKEDGADFVGFFTGASVGPGLEGFVNCDPTRETVYFGKHVFDLKTGAYAGRFRLARPDMDDIAFDKRGYLHAHWNPCFAIQGVSRADPGRGTLVHERGISAKLFLYPEVPYDYGIEKEGPYAAQFLGVLPVRDQCGAKGFQDGIGVNMRGDVAEQCNIYYVPKMEELGEELGSSGIRERGKSGFDDCGESYAAFAAKIKEMQRRGEEVYSIKRRPGIPLCGGTVWTFDRSGELRRECAAIGGDLINGVQIDENGAIYFVNARTKMCGDKPFLWGRGGTFGAPEDKSNRYPFTGTLIKSGPNEPCAVLLASSPVPLEPAPSRPADLAAIDFAGVFGGKDQWCWVEGGEWLYAGASPVVSTGCTCPTLRFHTDWYKRTFVPEAYRHSFGVLDANGNLIMHLGRYGNHDDAAGLKPGVADICLFQPRFISGTDNYLVFFDWGERLVVLKIAYQAEETVRIQ